MTQPFSHCDTATTTSHLRRLVNQLNVVATCVSALLLCSNTLYAADGGRCTSDDDRQFAQVTKLLPAKKNRDRQVEIITADAEVLTIPAWKLESPAFKGQYLEIDIRRNLLGTCTPFSVLRGEALQKKGVNLNPSDPQLYQGAFALEINRNCRQSSDGSCAGEPLLSSHLTLADTEKLTNIKPRSIGSCSPSSLDVVWSQIAASSESRLLACVKDTDDSERVVEFLLVQKEEKEQLELNRLY
ncbi:MAG: hypothetical protein CL693_16860 [Cellvibrionaceae bacterium]|nr:hypothetical protein [Cellvibrionaceae bacterium]|tara:strand:+ start:5546 stop:6271 length:726 start_codon:yes stop_codon:yes gene_type:complete